MKKLILIALSLALCTAAQAQKKGGFMNALKRGVESSTGLNVSKEALVVYPTSQIGEWKIAVVSCIGNPELSTITTTLKVTKVSGQQSMATRLLLTEAKASDGTVLGFGKYSADPLWDFKIGAPVEIAMQVVGGVPDGAAAYSCKFFIGDFASQNNIFELRDCPIKWVAK